MQKHEIRYINELADEIIHHLETEYADGSDRIHGYVAAEYHTHAEPGQDLVAGVRIDRPYEDHRVSTMAKLGGIGQYLADRQYNTEPVTPTP